MFSSEHILQIQFPLSSLLVLLLRSSWWWSVVSLGIRCIGREKMTKKVINVTCSILTSYCHYI